VHAVELDRSLEPRLREAVGERSNVTLHFGDALRLDLAGLDPQPTKLVSNLPYNVATPLVVESLDGLPAIGHWTVMVQREVADRFFAQPSTKAYGAVSVLVQLAAKRTGFHPVSRTVFRPRPNVDSALVAFRRRELPHDFACVKRVVTAAFAHRRKQLANSLELAGVADRDRAAQALTAVGRDASTRAEELAPPEFVTLTRALEP
jgi:16S rRNA (adenine1518-N6/adenine1519-N6)-dimethyltransferase